MSASYFIMKFLRRKRKMRKQVQKTKETEQESTPAASEDSIKCRICLNIANIPIFRQECGFDVVDAVRTYGGVEISEYDDYPQHLCRACYTFLQNAVAFRKTAQETERLLRDEIHTEYADVDTLNENVDETCDTYEETSKVYCCKMCKLEFKSSNEYSVHKNSKSHRNVRIQCTICHRLLIGQFRYKKHLAQHKSASHLVCEICGKLYRKNNLERHLQLHSHELPFQCQVCPYRGKFKESLKVHMRIHTGEKPYLCNKCNLRFLTRSNLNRHMLTHTKDKPYKCVECGRGFYRQRDLDDHFKSDHTGVKDYSCRFCGKMFGNRSGLMRHEIQIHKRDKMVKGRMPLYLQDAYHKNGN